jgi:hypothetical protein
MNKLKLFLAAVLLSVTTTFSFATNDALLSNNPSTNSDLRSEINDLFDNLDVEALAIEGEEKITIEFIVTDDSKILVTKTSNKRLDDTVKYLLNYKTVSTENIKKNEKYILPIILKK